jgi:L-lactate dehydrogenase
MEKQKIVIVGTGFVGMSYAYSLINQGIGEEIVLVDINKEKAEGEAMDLNHGLSFSPKRMKVSAGTYDDCKDAMLVVISAGVNQKPGETRLMLLQRNAIIIQSVIKQIMASGFNGVILMATNPVDILTHIAWKTSGLPSSQVIGSGTSLDTARLRYELAEKLEINVANIHAYMLGEHGDSEFVCWSNAVVGVKPLRDVMKTYGKITEADLDLIYKRVKTAAYEIISRKQASYYGIGMVLAFITKAILLDEHRIIPLSVLPEGLYDAENMHLGLPAVVTRKGIHHVVQLTLNDEEKRALKASSSILKSLYEQLNLS